MKLNLNRPAPLLACALTLALLPARAGAQNDKEIPKIGLAVATTINVTDAQATLVVESMAKALTGSFEIEVVHGPAARAKLPPDALAETCLGSVACLVNAGKALEVEELLMLVVVGVGDQVKIETTWVDVAGEKTALRPALDSALRADALEQTIEAEAVKLLPEAPVRPSTDTVVAETEGDAVGSGASPPPGPLLRDRGSTDSPPPPRGKRLDSTTTALAIGGGSALLASFAMFGYIASDCEEGFTFTGKNRCENANPWRFIADGSAIVGTGLLAFSLWRYVSSDEPERERPMAVSVGQDHLGFSIGGRF